MKTNSFTIFTAGIASALILPVSAIEAPEDNAPPPPAADAPAAEAAPAVEAAAKPEAKAESAYLGVVSSEVPKMLADHLGLKAGEGIVVRAVMPDGPAAKAGLSEHDIITKVGGEAVGSSLDLTKQVTSHKPGDTIHLDVIQKGKAGGADVTLGTRPDQIAGMRVQPLEELNLEGIPKELADRVRGAIQGNLGGMNLNIEEGAVEVAPQMEEAVREMRKRVEKAMGGINIQGAPGMPKIDIQQGATFRMMDEQGSIELKSNDDGKEVTLRDKEDKITWTGPWDTAQDKAAAPDDVRKRVERMNIDPDFKGQGFRLKMGGIQAPNNEPK